MHSRKKILVLGGGSGGVVAATKLGRALGRDHDVTLIDRREQYVFMPAFLFMMVGQRNAEDITRSLRGLEKHNVKVIQAEILNIDVAKQKVTVDSGPLSYDFLIVSLGMQTAPELIPGFAQGSHHAWELESTLRLRNALEIFTSGRILVGVPPGPYRCPPAPYEAQWMLDSYFRRRGLRKQVTIEFFTRDSEPSGDAHEPLVWMDAQSKKRNIKQHYDFVVQAVDCDKRTVRGIYGYELGYDLLFMVPPHRPSRVIFDSHLAETESGIRVDYDTLATKWENVYAIGDCADMPASKAGVVAHQEADVVAHNLITEITGRGRPIPLRLHTI